MDCLFLLLSCACCSGLGGPAEDSGGPCLYCPAYSLDGAPGLPAQPYCPQPGDIFLATDHALWARAGHWCVGGAGVHHSGIMIARPDGQVALLQAGPFNSLRIEILDPLAVMRTTVQEGDRVWIRRRRIPLTPEQSAELTAFACVQEGKRFALWRMLAQVTPFRSRGPLRSWLIGKPNGGNRTSYFCSELVMESCVAAGLVDSATARPCATYPRDLFFGKSFNWYLNCHLTLEPGWYPPAPWCEP
ncbi:MAG TPA: hypothetical protein VK395_22680 [Gemmataceae bacterium]|nr:hypothetical protein [Gemmataceae bacterium]